MNFKIVVSVSITIFISLFFRVQNVGAHNTSCNPHGSTTGTAHVDLNGDGDTNDSGEYVVVTGDPNTSTPQGATSLPALVGMTRNGASWTLGVSRISVTNVSHPRGNPPGSAIGACGGWTSSAGTSANPDVITAGTTSVHSYGLVSVCTASGCGGAYPIGNAISITPHQPTGGGGGAQNPAIGLRVSTSCSGINPRNTLNWNALNINAPTPFLYDIYRDGTRIASNRTGTSYTDASGLSRDTSYSYRIVRLANNNANPPVSTNEETVSVTTNSCSTSGGGGGGVVLPPPAAPLKLTGKFQCNGSTRIVNLSWDSAGSGASYQVFKGNVFQSQTAYGAPTSSRTLNDSNVSAGVTYRYFVSATVPPTKSPFGFNTNITTNVLSNSVDISVGNCSAPPPPPPQNQAPNAQNDSSQAQAGNSVNINVLANDSDPEGALNTASLSIITQPQFGTATVSNGQVAFNANSGPDNIDHFVYQICDTGGLCDTAQVGVNITNPGPTSGAITYNWIWSSPTIATLGSSSTNPTSLTAPLDCNIVGQRGDLTVAATLLVRGRSLTVTSPNHNVVITDPCSTATGVQGDIFGQTGVNNLDVDGLSVVSGASINIEGQAAQIDGYSRTEASAWSAIQQAANNPDGDLRRLISESAITKTTLGNNFVVPPVMDMNPDNRPEGGLIYIPGDLIIGRSVEFRGKGTFIVEGRIISNSNPGGSSMSYPVRGINSVGFIVFGTNVDPDIELNGFTNIIGSYFAPNGTFRINPALDATGNELPVLAEGLFVADQIDLVSKRLTIHYDGSIAQNPPPGFTLTIVPNLTEVNP